MGKLINYLGSSKILKRIADVLNVTDVKVNGTSVVDEYGVANITGGGGASALDDLTDVSITTPTDYQALVYNDTDDEWENSSLDLNFLSDVSISSPSNKQVFQYNSTSLKWENTDASWVPLTGNSTIKGNIIITKNQMGTEAALQLGHVSGYNAVSGKLTVYNSQGCALVITPGGGNGSRAITLPAKNGTIAMTSDLPSDFVPASTGGTFEGDVTIDKADGTTSVVGQSKIVLGNSTLSSADENSKGVVRLYSRGSKYVDICAPDGSAINDNRELNVPDKNGTIATTSDVDAVDLTKGGTIKAASGNTVVTIEGASSSNYGQIQLKRNGKTISITPHADVNNDRNITIPNAAGNIQIGSKYYGKSVTGASSDTFGTLIETLRTTYFDDGYIRGNQLRVSSCDGQGNMIFNCQRFQSQSYSVWGSFRGSGSGLVFIVMTFGPSSTALRKYELTTTGLTITNMTSTSAEGITITII